MSRTVTAAMIEMNLCQVCIPLRSDLVATAQCRQARTFSWYLLSCLGRHYSNSQVQDNHTPLRQWLRNNHIVTVVSVSRSRCGLCK